jgi:N-terminal domain of toast_rack, DUF2154
MKTKYLLMNIVFIATLLLSSCGTARVGALQTESKSVELGDAKSVSVEINLGAGDLQLTGGAEKLIEADFTYNVAKLKPEVEYKDGTLSVRQPEVKGMSSLVGITDYRNEWGLRLNDQVPMDLIVDVGAGGGTLQLDGLSLSGLNVSFGAGIYTVDLSGDWARNLDVTIEAGAAFLTVRLPRAVGVRVKVESGPHTIDATGLTKGGDVYTNAAYGVSDVTLHIDLQAGIGTITLVEIE